MSDKYIFFWGGEFSQWYPCSFMINNIEYNCAGQYMMAQKAAIFQDWDSFAAIMKSKNPRDQKAIGRKVKNFDVKWWETICREIVEFGNHAKFAQNPDLLEVLLSTGDKEIVEASPYDKIWGIGLAENDPRCLDKSQWQGKNWLGECIMNVRKELRYELALKKF